AGADDTALWSYSHGEDGERIGLRLRDGVIEMRLGDGFWQALTDGSTVTGTALRITPLARNGPLQSLCARPGDADTPTLWARRASVEIAGHAAGEPRIARSVRGVVHLRNDLVSGACTA